MTTVDQVTLRRRGTGLIAYDPQLSAGGYTLFAPQTANKVHLIDMLGKVVHEWNMPVRPGRTAVILPNGNLGYNGNHPNSPSIYGAWSLWHGGAFSEVTPSGEVVWTYEDPMHHHDAQWLPNGHLLYAACAPLPEEIAARIQGGTAYGKPGAPIYGDVIREVDRSGTLVWEWKCWEHLAPEDFPIHVGFGRSHWPLINGLGVTKAGLVLMSLRTTSGIIGVERATGDVTLHIGPDVLSHQHAPVELPSGNILCFDNGNFRPGMHIPASRIIEIDPVTQQIQWKYADEMLPSFFSPYMGSAQRLPNGNTHITESASGRLFEVTPDQQVVWEYVIPYFAEYPDEETAKFSGGHQNSVFQTFRYTKEQLPWLVV
ncbi:MAG: aryl sulfotransferase [Rhizobacter sp.]|nr:aryl sulfotransferase [Rhizobacter sp.]